MASELNEGMMPVTDYATSLCFAKPTASASLRAKAAAMEEQVLQDWLFSESLPKDKDVRNAVLFRRARGKMGN